MGDHVDAEAFSNELAALKRDGCNVLVVSDAPGRGPACERLLGAPELDRSHVFVTTSSDVSTVLDRHRPRRTDAGSFGVVDATPATGTRSAAASTPATDAPTLGTAGTADVEDWYDRVDDLTDFDALFAATKRTLDRVAVDADGPGGLRFCLDGLDPLFGAVEGADGVDEEALFRFLHLLSSAVRQVDGMGHFHASASVDDDHLATVEPLFDATLSIETTASGTVQQRWRLHESGRVTDWFEF
ncbi:DUF7504 family protein [Halobacterium wangiae]|uniref:DUF7504 family protein n=1 Tax=Halobacterium wangiae TaxID=2902623 RepID=UPI001E622256|nr:hypothetical protein [Halobacterium wangiae]